MAENDLKNAINQKLDLGLVGLTLFEACDAHMSEQVGFPEAVLFSYNTISEYTPNAGADK